MITNVKNIDVRSKSFFSGFLSEGTKSSCAKHAPRVLFLVKCLKQKTITPYICKNVSCSYSQFIPTSGFSSLPILHCVFVTFS